MTIEYKKLLKGFACVAVCLFGMQQVAFSSDRSTSEETAEDSKKSRSLRSKVREAREAAKGAYGQAKKTAEESAVGKIALEKYGQAKEMGQDILKGGKDGIEEMVQKAVCAFNMQSMQSLQERVKKLQGEISKKKASLSQDLEAMTQKKRQALQEKRQELEGQISKLRAEWNAKFNEKEEEEDSKITAKTVDVNEKIADKMESLQELKSMLLKMREKCNIPADATDISELSPRVANALPTAVSSGSSRSSRKSGQ